MSTTIEEKKKNANFSFIKYEWAQRSETFFHFSCLIFNSLSSLKWYFFALEFQRLHLRTKTQRSQFHARKILKNLWNDKRVISLQHWWSKIWKYGMKFRTCFVLNTIKNDKKNIRGEKIFFVKPFLDTDRYLSTPQTCKCAISCVVKLIFDTDWC